MTHGNIQKLLAPIDSRGARCGMDSAVKDKPYLVFFDISKCLQPGSPIVGCPTPQARYYPINFKTLTSTTQFMLLTFYILVFQVCVEQCPTKTILFKSQMNVDTFDQYKSHMVCQNNVNANTLTYQQAVAYIDDGTCASYVLQSQAGNYSVL